MSKIALRGFLRAPRRGEEITLGADGRPQPDEDPLAGMGGGTPEETVEAASIVERARERADDLVRQAALAAATIEQEAYAQGFTAGRREGTAAARADLAQALALVQRVAGEAKAMRDRLYEAAEREIVELVIASTEAVIGDHLATDPELVHETVRRALARAGSQNIMRVRVSRDERERVAARLTEEHGEVLPFQVIADGAVRVGGCLVDTQAGRVDARLDVQMSEIARLLREALPEASLDERPDEWTAEHGANDAR